MKKVKFIYNPSAGDSAIIDKLDGIIKVYQQKGYAIFPIRLDDIYNMEKALEDINCGYSHILVAGGDGTVDLLINQMMELKVDLPIGILPTGTANDFSKYIGMPIDIIDACRQILVSRPMKMDLGKVNDRYFVNVASTGLFTDVSQKTDNKFKNSIGKLAYYLKGIEQIPNFKKIPVKITSKDAKYNGDMYMILVFNGRMAGNIELAYRAHGNDGKLDVILIKAESLVELFPLLIKFLKGDHLEEPVGLLYFQTDELYIETEDNTLITDIDGERGPDFPLRIECVKNAISVLGVNRNVLNIKKNLLRRKP
jgi:YegS/Rv2252/BmrU family lipid kinase